MSISQHLPAAAPGPSQQHGMSIQQQQPFPQQFMSNGGPGVAGVPGFAGAAMAGMPGAGQPQRRVSGLHDASSLPTQQQNPALAINGFRKPGFPQPGSQQQGGIPTLPAQQANDPNFIRAFLQAQAQAQAQAGGAVGARPPLPLQQQQSFGQPGQAQFNNPLSAAAAQQAGPRPGIPNTFAKPMQDPTMSNAVAGPSNPNHYQQQSLNSMPLLTEPPSAVQKPSKDQLLLMQRLSEMSKAGGMPIQPLFTRTVWEPSGPEAEPIPEFTNWDKRCLKEWMQRDIKSVEIAQNSKNVMQQTIEEYAQDMLNAQDWLGPVKIAGAQNEQRPFRLRSRKEMERDLARGKRKARPWLELCEASLPTGRQLTRLACSSKKQLKAIARSEETLIPIRIDIEHEGRKCNETFTWNLNDDLINPQIFAVTLCEDLLLPHEHFLSAITSNITEQIKQFQEAEELHPRSLFVTNAPQGTTSKTDSDGPIGADQREGPNEGGQADDEDEWWENWRKKIKLSQDVQIGEEMPDVGWSDLETPEVVLLDSAQGEEKETSGSHEELRILISLDISIDNMNLKDQFEWDLADQTNSPEEFAEQLCADLGLPGEFMTAAAHSIREQLDAYTKALSSIRHIRGDQIVHDELRPQFQPYLTEGIRGSNVEAWTPHLEKLNLLELEHREKERERQSRRQKRGARNNRRNVVTLPDREPLRTSRTILPKPGASLIVPERNLAEDAAGIAAAPSYDIAQPYDIKQRTDLGPAPRMSSESRRLAKPKSDAPLASSNGDAGSLSVLPKPPGKKRGRPPNNPAAREAAAAANPGGVQLEQGSPPAGATPLSTNGSPFQASKTVKKGPFGRPAKEKVKAGWTVHEGEMHPNIIDGKWHCTNCGVPEPVAIGRRKGPLGDKTQCAECGKFYMSNKGRLRPCEYNTDPAYHIARQHGFNPAVTAANVMASNATTPAAAGPDSPHDSEFQPNSDEEYKPDESMLTEGRSRANSEISAPSLSSQGKRVPTGKGKGKGLVKAPGKQLPSTQASPGDVKPSPKPPQHTLPIIKIAARPSASAASPPTTNARPPAQGAIARKRPDAPQWIVNELSKLHKERPDDRFEVVPKPPANPEDQLEWRLKCLDCPGKVYKTGPGETLDNFGAHLRFKGHRLAVQGRLSGQGAT